MWWQGRAEGRGRTPNPARWAADARPINKVCRTPVTDPSWPRPRRSEEPDMKFRIAVIALLGWSAGAGAAPADPALDALVAAYPDFLTGYQGNDLLWRDGTRTP